MDSLCVLSCLSSGVAAGGEHAGLSQEDHLEAAHGGQASLRLQGTAPRLSRHSQGCSEMAPCTAHWTGDWSLGPLGRAGR